MAADEVVVLEQTLFHETGVWFYQVPPGHVTTLSPRADAWDPEHPFLTGALRVVQRGDACWVRLYEPAAPDADPASAPTLFAQCPVEITRELSLDAYVQDCVDSSRYFMVRVEDEATQRRAYVGVGFPERASAFNFKAALQDHAKYALRQLEAAALSAASEAAEAAAAASAPGGGDASPSRKSQAFSLPEGQTMRINLKLNGADGDKLQRRRSSSGGDGASASSGPVKVPLIPPPPGDLTPSSAAATTAGGGDGGGGAAEAKAAQTQAASVVAGDDEDWGDFTSADLHGSDADSLDADPSPLEPPRAKADARARERSSFRSIDEQLRPRNVTAGATEKKEPREESDADDHVVQVAIRCRPRKRPRHERHAASRTGLHRSREWLSRVSRDDSDDSDESSGASSDAGFGSTGVLEFSSERHQRSDKRSLHAQQKPSLLVQTQQGSGGAKRRFEFDFVFPPSAHQCDVYDRSVREQVAHVLRAHELSRPPTHATVVAYGQTGTGKTYTMGMLTSVHDEAERGVIPRAVAQVMEYVESYNSQPRDGADECVVVSMSYLQIYLETIQDLLVFPVNGGGSGGQFLSPAPTDRQQQNHHHRRRRLNSSDLPVRQRQNQAFYVEGLSEYEVSSLDDVHVLLETATRNRILASTVRNKTSSRSHTLLTISLKRRGRHHRRHCASSSDSSDSSSSSDDESQGRNDEDGGDDAYSVSFVDLAGSERVDGALHFLNTTRRRQELRIREAKFINRSLSALGSVIAALAQPRQHRGAKTSLAATLVQLKRTGRAPATSQQQQQQQAAPPPRHIRFRDSQLTKLLQSRLLSDRGRLLLIATVDDQRANLTETLSTLKFASQCRRVELRSLRSRAAKRKDSLLEQVFQEMKATYEEREAALRREYQSRIDALEAQLRAAESDTSSRRNSAQSAAYSALCALADQAPPASGEQRRHPEAASFRSEKDLVSYVTALYSHVRTALKTPALLSEAVVAGASDHQPTRGRSNNVERTVRERRPSPTLAPPALQKRLSNSLVLTADASGASKAPPTKFAATQLSPADEVVFKAVARLLLSSPEMLAAYHVAPDVDVDAAFSQIDATQ